MTGEIIRGNHTGNKTGGEENQDGIDGDEK